MSFSTNPTNPTRVRRTDSRPSSRLYASGGLAWGTIAKIISGMGAIIGMITFIVGLGVRYGTLQSTVIKNEKQIEELHLSIAERTQESRKQIEQLTNAVKAQNELIVTLRIAVAASAAADEVRRGGTYNRSEVLGVPTTKSSSKRVLEQQARSDAMRALDKTKDLDPLAGLDGL